MRVPPLDLNACGSGNFQPLINTLKEDGPTVFDDINGEFIAKTNLTTLLFETINVLNQRMCGGFVDAGQGPLPAVMDGSPTVANPIMNGSQ